MRKGTLPMADEKHYKGDTLIKFSSHSWYMPKTLQKNLLTTYNVTLFKNGYISNTVFPYSSVKVIVKIKFQYQKNLFSNGMKLFMQQ